MESIKKMRPSGTMVLAILALVFAVAGTATAASSLINGAKLKNNTVAGKKLKNKTITTAKLAPSTVKALKGQQGAQGIQGIQGQKGDPGANGVVSAFYKEFDSVNLPEDTELGVAVLNVPAGKYAIDVAVNGFNVGAGKMQCAVSTNGGGGSSIGTSAWESTVTSNRGVIPINYVTETKTVTSITVGCVVTDTSGSASGSITAIPVQ